MKPNAFPKAEHLCLRHDIEELFSAGSHATTAYPLRAVYRCIPYSGGPKVRVLLSVAKRRLHHAVDRNRAKRQLREAYRLNKTALTAALADDESLNIGFIWLSEHPVDTAVIAQKVTLLLRRITEKTAEMRSNGTKKDKTSTGQ